MMGRGGELATQQYKAKGNNFSYSQSETSYEGAKERLRDKGMGGQFETARNK
ncbi:MAG: hypothetical protein ACQER7_10150 [Bacteroidota bacterium]